jgi:hypothetical protein
MIEIAREMGASGKFPGSGGAIVGVVDVAGMAAAGKLPTLGAGMSEQAAAEGGAAGADPRPVSASRVRAALEALRDAYTGEGFVFTPLFPLDPAHPDL